MKEIYDTLTNYIYWVVVMILAIFIVHNALHTFEEFFEGDRSYEYDVYKLEAKYSKEV